MALGPYAANHNPMSSPPPRYKAQVKFAHTSTYGESTITFTGESQIKWLARRRALHKARYWLSVNESRVSKHSLRQLSVEITDNKTNKQTQTHLYE